MTIIFWQDRQARPSGVLRGKEHRLGRAAPPVPPSPPSDGGRYRPPPTYGNAGPRPVRHQTPPAAKRPSPYEVTDENDPFKAYKEEMQRVMKRNAERMRKYEEEREKYYKLHNF